MKTPALRTLSKTPIPFSPRHLPCSPRHLHVPQDIVQRVSWTQVEVCLGASKYVFEVSIEIKYVLEHICPGAQVSWRYVLEVCLGAQDTLTVSWGPSVSWGTSPRHTSKTPPMSWRHVLGANGFTDEAWTSDCVWDVVFAERRSSEQVQVSATNAG